MTFSRKIIERRIGMLTKDEILRSGDNDKIWQKYCGFLDLSLREFMEIQEHLLLDEIEMVTQSPLGKKIMKVVNPRSVEEFRQLVPLTTYDDYASYLGNCQEDALAEKPCYWAHTSGKTGFFKWVPYTLGSLGRLADDTISAFILSAAMRKGEVHIHEGVKVVHNLPPPPYTSGIIFLVVAQRISFQAFPPLEKSAGMQFQERIEEGFRMALSAGLDFAGSLGVVLVKVGESFSQLGRTTKLFRLALHPMAVFRLLRAIVKSRLAKRPMLPKDIWRVKGLVCGGTDTFIYREQIVHYWGVQPLDIYVATETGFIAMQGWNKKGMTFMPYSNFYEFIPEAEWLKSREDSSYQPATVLLSEVKEGKLYELVITNFHGMPFLRYRLGDLIRISSLKDDEIGVNLPQMVFQRRGDDIIDIAGFARLDEKTIWQAIQNSSIPYEDWTARKEYRQSNPILRIYLELKENRDSKEVERLIDEQLRTLDTDYNDMRNMIELKPIVVSLLSKGTFHRYLQEKETAGFDLAHLKPAHVNAPDAVIDDLRRLSQGS